MTQSKRIILTGGGTGGHIYPNLALLPALKAAGFTPVYVGGSGECMERRLARQNALTYYSTDTIKLVRAFNLKAVINNLKIPFLLDGYVKQARTLIETIRPCAVFSKGGFVSLPIVLAACKSRIPVICHESDFTLGLANKIAAKHGSLVLKANPDAAFDGIFTGMPLREKLFSATKDKARQKLQIDTPRKIILFVGGSSGAQALNEAVYENSEALCNRYFVLHLTGKGKTADTIENYEKIKSNYRQIEYADNIEDYYAVSDLVVSRAGATAVFELSALQKRALFIPLPKAASRGDQLYNAELARRYGASVLEQNGDFSKELFKAVEKALIEAPMRVIENDANGKIVQIISDSIRRGEICKDKKPSPNGLP